MSLSAVILAGGQSKRMGCDKAWIWYEGKPLIQAAIDKICNLHVDEIFIFAREDQNCSRLNCRVLLDLESGRGPPSSIERALRESAAPLVLVLPVDLPKMTAERLRALAQSCDRLNGAIAKVEGELQPLVDIYSRRFHTYAVNSIAGGDHAVHKFASACLHEKAIKVSIHVTNAEESAVRPRFRTFVITKEATTNARPTGIQLERSSEASNKSAPRERKLSTCVELAPRRSSTPLATASSSSANRAGLWEGRALIGILPERR